MTDIQNDNCPARLSTLFENGIDQNGEGAYNNNIDDQILVFEGCGKDMMYIDFYDTGRFARGMGDYRTSVKITGTDTTLVTLSGLMCFNTTGLGFAGALNCWEDTKLWSPRGADMITVTNYGSDRQVKAVEICHPTKKAYITYFLGKEKTESETMTTIIAEDVGKLKQTGCCEAIVKSFGLSAGNAASATGTCQNMKPVGTIVVTNATANTNNNLIVIGKPSVNPLSTGVTDEEIHNDPEKYVIKLVNNHTLVVAGWEGNDTIAAANKVIEWLLANAHDGGTTTTYTTLDVNNDGSVDIFDAIKILEFISGI
ncbi:MAG: hypothetical protein CVT89_06145 [Candidatus Altiarchaeales archaeon HGW-Altiarchaeales-2]|nr:MAG: hypothetical protein CVT89_06145 [Candidatus Altiarchaeales archaeon HGW-Altiarchaeales-2]